nr:hypothetical protein [Tanacetum cinerariifolium]GFB53287.1 hypothetical protein [Tanacetum cinerariifolium]
MNWDINIQGHAMYKLVKKLKVLKPHLNKLNWKNGNLFGRVSELKAKLQTIQKDIDKDPTNKSLRAEGIEVLKWRLNKNRIMYVCAEDGKRYDNCEVAEQFGKHFEGFLGINPEVTKMKEDDGVLFDRRISMEEANLMIREIQDDEIKKALFGIDDNKAPGPHG